MTFKLSAFADESSDLFTGQVAALKRNGFQHLEIRNIAGRNITTHSCQEAQELANILADNGLSLWSLGSPIGKIRIDEDFSSHMELYRHALELTKVFGAENIRLFSFFMPKDQNPEDYASMVIDRMGAFVELAKEYGIHPCHENEKGIYGDIASRCLKLHQAIPELEGVFDPANFVQCGQDTLEAWDILHPYVRYMHIKDATADGKVVPPGIGCGHVPELIKKYHAQGGSVLSLEPHLYEFVGLKALEQEGNTSDVGGMSFATPEDAFDYAAKTLKNILEG